MRFSGLTLILVLFSACGKSNSNAGLPIPKRSLPINRSPIIALHMTRLETINGNGNLSGTATLQRRDEKFHAFVRLTGGTPHSWHIQNIHTGRCPVPADDANADGLIDIEEANHVLGQILLPLDSNINSQGGGENVYPISDEAGNYFYERKTNFTTMLNDLKKEDPNPNDNMMKLAQGTDLDFTGKVVVIHGAPETVVLPPSVVTANGWTAHQTLPVACGILELVTNIPEDGPDTTPGSVGNGEVATSAPDTTQPLPGNIPRPESHEDDEDDDNWYDRILDWWRDTWERERRGRSQYWGDGGGN